MARRWLAGLAVLAMAGVAEAQWYDKAHEQPPRWASLERFANDAELLDYLREVDRVRWRPRRGAANDEDEAIVVTGTRLVRQDFEALSPITTVGAEQLELTANLTTESLLNELPQVMPGEGTSITNVQTQGVDEGGIVKMVGRFLVILQDGRLFVVDTRPDGEPGLALIGRTNVYRDAGEDTWYDEMLISGDRVLVTGYSYREEASEITVLSISDAGALTREATYYISSNDYYDHDNYATRLVNGNLVIYTPLDLSYFDPDERITWPIVRRWLREGVHRAVTTAGQRLFDARDIYKPLAATRAPMVHSVSVCPLGQLAAGDELDCRTTAFIGPQQRQFFVSTSDIYLWVTPDQYRENAYRCLWDEENANRPAPGVLYQLPVSGETPRAMHVRGEPVNQLAMDASATEFSALLGWNTGFCSDDDVRELRFFRVPLANLDVRPQAAPESSYTNVPSVAETEYEVRFTDTHVVYGGANYDSGYKENDDEPAVRSARVVAVPVDRPDAAVSLTAPHAIIRIERAGDRIVLTGYRNEAGLSISVLDLAARPRITDTAILAGRYESENRSHAFNSLVGRDGAAVIGLPTVTRIKESGRWVWRSDASDLSFLWLDAGGALQPLGAFAADENAADAGYACEVSCVDWYGNTRALFIGRRVLGLSGTELIEGAIRDGRITELRRLNLSAPPQQPPS